MVFYFTCSDPRYTIYMGRDKYENEDLIKYGWPEDLWFHVDKMSSAHVYLRLPPGETIDDVAMDIVHECAQLTKLNSIEGCKVNNVTVVYTMWANLRKSGDMATGQVGFHKRGEVRSVVVEKRINEIVNRLNKTKEEKHNHPSDLAELRAARDKAEIASNKQTVKQQSKAEALAREDERSRAVEERQAAASMAAAAEAERERLEHSLLQAFAAGTVGGSFAGESEDDDDPTASREAAREKDLTSAHDAWRAFDESLVRGNGPDDEASESEAAAAWSAEALAAKAELLRKMDADKAKEREALTALAHQRRADAQAKAEAEAAARAARQQARKEAASAALDALQAKRDEVGRKARQGRESARASLEEAAARGTKDASLEENAASHQEEAMVLESIFADDYAGQQPLIAECSTALQLTVRTTVGKDERSVVLAIEFPPQYPSHLPPFCRVLEGVRVDDVGFFVDSLYALFFDSPGEMVVHTWSEWIKDTWLPLQARH
ncbi:hypothetical protein AB1Y20_015442 [Prymnesium parvum]|uniref:RWD domain-containing protein n=1 Tax=Prymnesium parvum TaxID=97485 RepID=A0AB34JXR9_PRYPA